MRRVLVLSPLLWSPVLAVASAACAQPDLPDPSVLGVAVTTPPLAAQLAAVRLGPLAAARLQVSSPGFPTGGDIPLQFTRYRQNRFPGLAWSAGPPSTRSYAVILQDPNSQVDGQPVLHWTAYDIPATVTSLEPGAAVALPSAARPGPNIEGPARPYAGPRTPAGPRHAYHWQVFALDAAIPPDPAMTYPQLLDAMRGHVVAFGELIGLGHRDPSAPPPASKPAAQPAPAPGPRG